MLKRARFSDRPWANNHTFNSTNKRVKYDHRIQADIKGGNPFVTANTKPFQIFLARQRLNTRADASCTVDVPLINFARLIGDEFDTLLLDSSDQDALDYSRAVPLDRLFFLDPTLKAHHDAVYRRQTPADLMVYAKRRLKNVDDFCREFQILGTATEVPSLCYENATTAVRCTLKGSAGEVGVIQTQASTKVAASAFRDLDGPTHHTSGMAYSLYLYIGAAIAEHMFKIRVVKSRLLQESAILAHMRKELLTEAHVSAANSTPVFDKHVLNWQLTYGAEPHNAISNLRTPSYGAVCRIGYCTPVSEGSPEYDACTDCQFIGFPSLMVDVGHWVTQ